MADADWARNGTTTIDSGDIDVVTSSRGSSGDVSSKESGRDDESPLSSGSHAEKSPKSDVSSPSSVENSPKHDASETKHGAGEGASDGDGGVSSAAATSTTPSKVCVVCSDKALSCNFGAITCESCKAFFRRNAHKV